MEAPENSANHVQDDQEDPHSSLSSLADVKQETQQFSVHCPANTKV